jgi:ssDNA-binding Zn-finger/Zn-ribbon topoisomerase 1
MSFNIDKKKMKIVHNVSEGDTCPYCNIGLIIIRVGKFSRFFACSSFPSCIFSQPLSKGKKSKIEEIADDILSKY